MIGRLGIAGVLEAIGVVGGLGWVGRLGSRIPGLDGWWMDLVRG